MISRLWDRFTYWTERRFVRGAQYRLLIVAALIGLISLIGGWAVLAWGSGFDRPGEAIWWAFLRLTDPGYLGDDVGTVNRVVSTILTVLGYVVFLGALVAVMTQWLDHRMKRLESGLTPVTRDDHIVILGLNTRTPAILREILLSEGSVRRFLRYHGTRRLHIVVLAEAVDATVVQDLRDAVGEAWDEHSITLRSGTPLRTEHLERVDALHASAVIIPGSEFVPGGAAQTDSQMVKTLLSLASTRSRGGGRARGAEWPLVVAEIFDARKVAIAERAYPGRLETVASDAIVSRLLAQNVRNPGISRVYNDVLTHGGGAELYVRTHPDVAGRTFDDLAPLCRRSIFMGVVRPTPEGLVPYLNPPGDFVVEADDRFVHLAPSLDEAHLPNQASETTWSRGATRLAKPQARDSGVHTLGWNSRVPALIHEFNTYERERFHVAVLSAVPASTRIKALARYGLEKSTVEVRHIEGDYAEVSDLDGAQPQDFDAVLLLGSHRREGAEESDARTIVGSLLLEQRGIPGPHAQEIIELLDPDNERLVDQSEGEVLVSPSILSHMLAHIALRPELAAVFYELFTAGGAEITFRPMSEYLNALEGDGLVAFEALQQVAHAQGEVALGVFSGGRGRELRLCPGPDSLHERDADAQLVTLLTYA